MREIFVDLALNGVPSVEQILVLVTRRAIDIALKRRQLIAALLGPVRLDFLDWLLGSEIDAFMIPNAFLEDAIDGHIGGIGPALDVSLQIGRRSMAFLGGFLQRAIAGHANAEALHVAPRRTKHCSQRRVDGPLLPIERVARDVGLHDGNSAHDDAIRRRMAEPARGDLLEPRRSFPRLGHAAAEGRLEGQKQRDIIAEDCSPLMGVLAFLQIVADGFLRVRWQLAKHCRLHLGCAISASQAAADRTDKAADRASDSEAAYAACLGARNCSCEGNGARRPMRRERGPKSGFLAVEFPAFYVRKNAVFRKAVLIRF